jgi:hypothetical protein
MACGIAASITLSRNLHAAICLAKGRLRHGRIQIIPLGTEAAALAKLSLSILDLTPGQADTFAPWGIRTLVSRFLRHPNHSAHHPSHRREERWPGCACQFGRESTLHELSEKTMIQVEDARRIIAEAEKKASEIGQPMNIAVAGKGGNFVVQVRIDGAWLGSIDISIKKAYTCRAFHIVTKDLATYSQSGGQFFGIPCFE